MELTTAMVDILVAFNTYATKTLDVTVDYKKYYSKLYDFYTSLKTKKIYRYRDEYNTNDDGQLPCECTSIKTILRFGELEPESKLEKERSPEREFLKFTIPKDKLGKGDIGELFISVRFHNKLKTPIIKTFNLHPVSHSKNIISFSLVNWYKTGHIKIADTIINETTGDVELFIDPLLFVVQDPSKTFLSQESSSSDNY